MNEPLTLQPELQAMIRERQVANLLYREAQLLDEWRLDEWLQLFSDDARYEVPALDATDGQPGQSLFLIEDDRLRLAGRVERLKSRWAHREFPTSRTRRLIGNITVEDVSTTGSDEVISATANFAVWRVRRSTDTFSGRYIYRLRRHDDQLRIVFRRAELDLEVLDPHGTVSIII